MNAIVKKYEVLQDLISFFREETYFFPPEFSEALRSTREILARLKDPVGNISAHVAKEKIAVTSVLPVGKNLDEIEIIRDNIKLLHQRIPEFFPTISNIVQFSQKLIDSFPYLVTVRAPDFGHLYPNDFGQNYVYAVNEDSLCGLLQNLANIFSKKGTNQPNEPIEEGVEILITLASLTGILPDHVAPNMLFKTPPSIVEELKICLEKVRKEFGPYADLYQSHFLDEVMHVARQSYEKLKYDSEFKGKESYINLRDFSGMEIKKQYLGLAILSQFIKKLFPKQ